MTLYFEVIGLPGCGKSSVLENIGRRLRRKGRPVRSLKACAAEALRSLRDEVGFLHRPERGALWAAMAFSEANPALFDAFVAATRGSLSMSAWTMDTLAQLHLAGLAAGKDEAIFLDEGLIHRAVAAYALRGGRGAEDGLERLLAALPAHHLTLFLDVPVQTAIDRAFARPRGIPPLIAGASTEETLANYRLYADLFSMCLDHQACQDGRLIRIDASGTLDETAALSIAALEARMSTPQPV